MSAQAPQIPGGAIFFDYFGKFTFVFEWLTAAFQSFIWVFKGCSVIYYLPFRLLEDPRAGLAFMANASFYIFSWNSLSVAGPKTMKGFVNMFWCIDKGNSFSMHGSWLPQFCGKRAVSRKICLNFGPPAGRDNNSVCDAPVHFKAVS